MKKYPTYFLLCYVLLLPYLLYGMNSTENRQQLAEWHQNNLGAYVHETLNQIWSQAYKKHSYDHAQAYEYIRNQAYGEKSSFSLTLRAKEILVKACLVNEEGKVFDNVFPHISINFEIRDKK